MASPLSLCLPTHSSATQATSAPNHRAGLCLKEHECSSSACTAPNQPPNIPSLSSSLAGWRRGSCPSPLSLAGEGGLLPPQGQLPKAAAVRSRRQGGKKKVKKRRRGGSGREAVKAALSSEQSERPLGGAPAPGAASRALGLPHGSSSIASSAAPQPRWGQPRILARPPGCSPSALRICGEGLARHADPHRSQMGSSKGLGIRRIVHHDVTLTVTFYGLFKGFMERSCRDLQLSKGNSSEKNPSRCIKRAFSSSLPH